MSLDQFNNFLNQQREQRDREALERARTDARKDARTTHALQFAQLAQGYVTYKETQRVAAAQERLALEQKRHTDAHLNYLWSQYLQTEAGKEFKRWENDATAAAQVRSDYDRLWQSAWATSIHELQGDLSLAPAPSQSKGHGCLLTLLAGGLFTLGAILQGVIDGTAAATLGMILCWSGLLLLCSIVPLGLLRARSYRRRIAAWKTATNDVLAHRGAVRKQAFGHEVVRVQVNPDGAREHSWLLSWSEIPPVGPGSAQRFTTSAFTSYPQPDQLPWHLTNIEQPRLAEPLYPPLVKQVLGYMLGGKVRDVAPVVAQRFEALVAEG